MATDYLAQWQEAARNLTLERARKFRTSAESLTADTQYRRAMFEMAARWAKAAECFEAPGEGQKGGTE